MLKELSLYAILRQILKELNEQVVDHGDRVAYLFLKMQEFRNTTARTDMDDMMLACYTHDIGAYKTEKFLDLLKFDVTNTLEHCVYGYLFMKYFSPLEDNAEVLLYHHTYYRDKNKYESKYLDDGILIHFLDRIDIFSIKYENIEDIISQAKSGSGVNFNPKDVDDFIEADAKYNILEKLKDGTYRVEVMNYFNNPSRVDKLLSPIINMLAYEVDFRSEQTVIHSATITKIAELLSRRLGMDEISIRDVRLAAELHDVGKINIAKIVEKKGKLSPDEYHIMKKHVVYTELIIGDLLPHRIAQIATRHHERLDGSGYPKGLKADELTLADRILQIADVTSALLQRRSYKEALDKESVIDILNKESLAGRLDDKIIALLIKDYDSIIADTMLVAKDVIKRYENLQKEYAYYINKYSKTELTAIDEFPLFKETN